MFSIGDHVRVVNRDKKIRKEGVIVRMTSAGVHIYDPTCVHPITDSIANAEWFPFECKEFKVFPSPKHPRRRKV